MPLYTGPLDYPTLEQTTAQRLAQPIGIPTAEQDEALKVGFGRLWWLATAKDNTLGAAAQRLGYAIGSRIAGIDRTVDPNYNVYDEIDEQLVRWYPEIVEDFLSHRILDVAPNPTAFRYYLLKKHEFTRERAELESAGFLMRLFAGAPGQLIEGAAGWYALKGLGLAATAKNIYGWGRTGSRLAQAGKMAALGGVTNLAQEEAIIRLGPERVIDNNQARLWAFGMGAAFGAAVPMLAGGRDWTGRLIGTRRIRGLQKEVAELFTDPAQVAKRNTVADMIADDVEVLKGEVARLAERPKAAAVRAAGAMEDVTAMVHDPKPVTVLDTPETHALIQKVRDAGGLVLEHPMQRYVDHALELERLQESVNDLLTSPGAKGTNAYARLMGSMSPGARLRRSPSAVARLVGRVLFDETAPTMESARNPVTATFHPSAESLRMGLDTYQQFAIRGVQDALDDVSRSKQPFTYPLLNGETVNVRSRHNRTAFHRAVTHYIWAMEEHARHGTGPEPTAPRQVVQAAKAVGEYTDNMARDAHEVGLLETYDPNAKWWLSHRWDRHAIKTDHEGFVRRLVAQFHQNRKIDYYTGKPIDPDSRTLISKVVERFNEADRKAYNEAVAGIEDVGEITEGWLRKNLGEDVYARYLKHVNDRFFDQAEGDFKALTAIENMHGIDSGMGSGSVFAHRRLEIDPSRFTDYLDDDLGNFLGAYHRQAAGRIATRQAVKRMADELAPLVKQLTGDDLIEAGYNPELLIKAVRQDFQAWIDMATQAKRPKLVEKLIKADEQVFDVLQNNLADLEGRPVDMSNPAAETGWRLFISRNIMRGPFTALLGKMTVTAQTDLAGLTFRRVATRQRIAHLRRALNPLKELPNRHLEYFSAANSDALRAARAMNLGEVMQTVDSWQFGHTPGGRALAKADKAGDWLARKFTSLTLMNRWNTNLKRYFAMATMGDIINDAPKMARAADLIAGGMDELAALKKVGLSQADAIRMNKRGMNGKMAKRLLDRLYEYGVDIEGNRPWKGNRAAFDKMLADGKKAVFPEFHAWHKVDRELFDTFTGMVNMELMDVIVEPKLLSRPLHTRHLWGKLFQQFQSFNFAWGNQLAAELAQRPATQQVHYLTLALGLGALSDAMHNALNGRRSFDETLQLWTEQPDAMLYAAMERGALMGWLSRPLGILERTPLGIGKLLGAEAKSMQYYQPVEWEGVLGPFFTWSGSLGRAAQRALYRGELDIETAHKLRLALPFENLVEISLIHRMTEWAGLDNPFGPGKGIEPFILPTTPAVEQRRLEKYGSREPQP